MAVTEVTKDRQVYDTKEEAASEIWANAIKNTKQGRCWGTEGQNVTFHFFLSVATEE